MHQKQDEIVKSVCPLDCPDQCGLLLHKKDGQIIKITGDPAHPVTQGNICNKMRHMHKRLYDPARLKYPLKRVGPKGSGQFERVSWEEALSNITSHWKKLIASDGPESILPYSFYGNMGNLAAEGMDRRFFNRLGSSQLERAICSAAGTEGYKYTMGGSFGSDPEDTIHSKLIIFWGINAASTNMHQVVLAQKARKQNGAKIVVIDVHQNQTAKFADWFIPILPGTDSALALGIMKILFAENLIDWDFLEKYTIGYKELREHVEQYEISLVSKITGVPVEDIYKLARLYGNSSPAFIRIGNGPQHHDNGGMCIRTISCLPALTGQWLIKGGGAIKGNSGYLAHNADRLQRPDLLPAAGRRVINMNKLGEALTNLAPPVKSLYVYSANPAVVAPDGNKVRQGLARTDLMLVVHDLFLTETAKYADYVLPATSSFEATDFYASYWHHYVQLQVPVIERYGEAKSNVEVFRLLAAEMGFQDEAFSESDADMIRGALDFPDNPYLQDISFERLLNEQYVKAKVGPLLPGKLPTPSGKIELYSAKMLADGYPPLPTYIPLKEDRAEPIADCHNREVSSEAFPFQFIAAPNHNFLNSTFAHNLSHQRFEKAPVLFMNADDANDAGIADGDIVKVWNHRGACELKVSVGKTVLPGVVVTQGLWGEDETHGRNVLVNSLTPARLADMGGGATFFSGRVAVEKLK